MSSLRLNSIYILALHLADWCHQGLMALKRILGENCCPSPKLWNHFCYHHPHWKPKNHSQILRTRSWGHRSDHPILEPPPEHHHTIHSSHPPASSLLAYFKLLLLALHGSPLCFASLWKSLGSSMGYCLLSYLSCKSLSKETLVAQVVFETPSPISRVWEALLDLGISWLQIFGLYKRKSSRLFLISFRTPSSPA